MRLAIRIVDAGQQQRHLRIGLGQRRHQRQRPPAARLDRLATPGIGTGPAKCVKGRAVRLDAKRLTLPQPGHLDRDPPGGVPVQMPLQNLEGATGVVTRRQPDADGRPGDWQQLVGRIRHRGSVDSQHGQRRPGPEPVRERAGADELDPRSQADRISQPRLVDGNGMRQVGVQSRDPDIAR